MTTNSDLLARRTEALPRGLVTGFPLFAARAANSELWDVEGRRFIDFAAGIATLNTGHCHPRVMDAVHRQLDQFTHTAFQVIGYQGYVELCERLNAIAPVRGEAKSVLFNTGAEATENAIKIARYATGRTAVISFAGGFHGRTLLATSMTGKVEPYKVGFGTLPGEVYHAIYPAPHRDIGVDDALRSIDFLLRSSVDPRRVAAVIVEPVQGEGGFNPAPVEFMRALRALCDEHGILLVVDEVQTGFGRTGRMFAIEHSEVEADLVTLAKSLGGGFPIAAVAGTAAIMEQVHPGGLGSTYGGSPMSCAAALAVLDVIEEEQLVQRAETIGARIRARLAALSMRNELQPIANVRGLGAMIAFDIVKDKITQEFDGVAAKRLLSEAADQGLILLTCGPKAETIRLLTPLTIPMEQLDEGLDILEEALGAIALPAEALASPRQASLA